MTRTEALEIIRTEYKDKIIKEQKLRIEKLEKELEIFKQSFIEKDEFEV